MFLIGDIINIVRKGLLTADQNREKEVFYMKSVNTEKVIKELHKAFRLFNENLFDGELPEPAILIQSRGNKKLTLGWCTVKQVWHNQATKEDRYEINLVAEALNRGVYPVLCTLLHEMIHLHNLVNNIKDVSRGGTYHNMKFKKTAEAHGLMVEHDAKIGWSVSKLQGLTMDLIDSAEFDEAVFSMGRRDLNFEGAGKPRKKVKTNVRKYVCEGCGQIIRATKQVNVLCGDCTDIENGKVVRFIEEIEEGEGGEEETPIKMWCGECNYIWTAWGGKQTYCPQCNSKNVDEMMEEDGEEPTDNPEGEEEEENKIEFTCKECGETSLIPEDAERVCHECGCIEAPEVIEPLPTNIIEIDTTINDGAGNMIPVKQGAFVAPEEDEEEEGEEEPAHQEPWTVERIEEVFNAVVAEFKENLNPEAPTVEGLKIEIKENMSSQWANYKEGKGFNFSKNYLENTADSEVMDTIKHEYVHHYLWAVEGEKAGHGKTFKQVCTMMGLDTHVPVRSGRALR